MRLTFFLVLLILGNPNLYSQTTTATYNSGDIPTSENVYDGACNGPITTLTVSIPIGDVVTAIDVAYNMTALNGCWMSEQRSQIYCQETGLDEGGYVTGSGTNAGTYNYSRTGLSIANSSSLGSFTFEMRAYRTYSETSGCNTSDNKVDDGSWTITVHHYTPAPMAFSSINAFQASTADITLGSTSQEIIGLEIITTGNTSPLDLTQLRINLGGSSDINDIVGINVYYTGSSSTYATTSLFGTVSVPTGTFIWANLTGNQTLSSGSNYFWLAVDVASGASIGNNIDARIRQAFVDGIDRLSDVVQNPAGNRPLIATTPDGAWPGYLIGDIGCPYNNTWTSATEDGGGIPVNNDCDYYSNGGDHIYSFNLTETSDVIIDLCGANTDFDTYLLLYSSTGDCNSDPIASNDDACGTQSSITQTGLSSGTYVIVIEGYGGATGNYDLSIDVSNCPSPMSFVSCTSSQANTDIVSTGTYNQEILKIEIETSGELNPIDLSEIRIRTDGTDNYLTDIENVRIWYTNTTDAFATTTLFGSAAVPEAAGTDLVFSGNQTLESGINYFWLTYNILSTATTGNVVDAKFQSCVVDLNPETPIVSEPVGNREIVDGCYHHLYLYDQGNNGWESASITIQVNGLDVLTNETLAAGNETSFSFLASDGDLIETFYTSGTNDNENRYTIFNPNGAFILSDGKDNIAPSSGLTANGDCISVSSFTPNASAYQTETNCFVITEDKSGESGSLWYNYMVSLNTNFQIEFDIYLGDKDITFVNDGADGLTFSLQGECSASGGDGSSMGYGGITPSIAVEFDTYQNSSDMHDPVADHIAIVSNGDVNHWSANHLAGPIDIASGIEDDAWHSVKIVWIESSSTFEVYFDGSLVVTYTGDIITDIFSNDPVVFWGFTGGTGLFFNRQEICVTSYPTNSTALTDIYCDICDEQVEVAQGANSYTWSPNDGSIDNPNVFNPTFTPLNTTEYTVEIEDACGNKTRDRFTIHVTLPVELTKFEANCINNEILVEWETSSETNNDFFILEKSFNAINFFEVSKIQGSGNSNKTKTYTYYDSEKSPEIVYYRLKQLDNNGNYEYSNTINALCYKSETNINLYPNPAKNSFEIVISEDYAKQITFQIFNSLGQKTLQGSILHSKTKVDVSQLQKGIYLIIIMKKGEIIVEKSLVIE